MAMTIRQELITPERAESLLGKNIKNRNIRERQVMRLAHAIERGEWRENNPQPISINGKRLFDGQHRLRAVIESGVAVKMWVANGVTEDVMPTLDTGISRRIGDILSMKEEPNAFALGGALGQVWLYRNYKLLGGKSREHPTHSQLLALLEREPHIRDSLFIGRLTDKMNIKGIGPSVFTAAHYLFTEIDTENGEAFFQAFISGEDLDKENPIWVLRRAYLERPRQDLRSPRTNAAMLIKAWNAWLDGDTVSVLVWRGGGRSPEPFPEIHG